MLGVEVELFDDLDAAAADARGALDREARELPFDRLSWYRLVACHCPPPGRLIVARGVRSHRKGWLFLAVEPGRARAWTSWYSLRWGLVGETGVMAAIAAALRIGGITRADFAPVADTGPLRAGFREAGWITFLTPATASWQVATAGQDFAAYWARRPGKLRSTAERKARAAGLDVRILTEFDPEAWEEYRAVYEASWKPEEGSFAFLRAFAEEEGAAGTLRLGIARKDGAPVAAQLWTVDNGTAWIHKLAYAESARALSPGTILSMEMFRHVLDRDRVARIDYGTGDEPYKADWMEERYTLWRVTAFDPRSLSGLAGAARAAASALVRRATSR
ncbi:MAG: GNAT family N-acetyltransferase [Allosphingosinicella sp.]|uniref:GNAT family N-acetyltransferase n=1 Tax=Allosphingosinicella sp. TaxID=2823234 RepID=UPI003948A646